MQLFIKSHLFKYEGHKFSIRIMRRGGRNFLNKSLDMQVYIYIELNREENDLLISMQKLVFQFY